ncbi:hypothetical protein PIB30_036733 [Stylosanthes scabra]|uniref:Uncharacterized protein n=1 Tax=Stylosanthes scabra TaxID=79078 RepID=A0ABU6RDM0_9FABA|nr:hypothetical protein [Stylosanthes scabra]
MPLKGEVPPPCSIEGYLLAKLTPRFTTPDALTNIFLYVFRRFLEANIFSDDEWRFLAPFTERNREKPWYKPVRFDANHSKDSIQKYNNNIWAEFVSMQLLPVGFPQHSKERFEVKLYAPNLMAGQFGFAQATPAPLSLLENKQAHRFKIDSIDGLIAALASNEDRRKQYSPFECEPCTMVTRAFNNWWNAYYKKFIRSFDQIKARADALRAMDQLIREKKQAKRKADPSGASKKITKKPKGDKASTSTKASKAKTSVVPLAPTAPTIQQVTNPEPSAVRSDASSGTKISEGEQLVKPRLSAIPVSDRNVWIALF